MKIYNYHPVTREFLSEGTADPDPLKDGEWLIPAYSTSHTPSIEPGENKTLVLNQNGDSWSPSIDLRGQKYWLEDGSEFEIENLGEVIPPGALFEKPDTRSLEERKSEALLALDQEHATILRTLTGNATIEERDTWQGKALAAEAFENGLASTSQTEMLTTEASMSGLTVEELVGRILINSVNFMKMVGIAAGHRTATKDAINNAADFEELENALTAARETANTLIADYLSATQGS